MEITIIVKENYEYKAKLIYKYSYENSFYKLIVINPPQSFWDSNNNNNIVGKSIEEVIKKAALLLDRAIEQQWSS